MYFDDIFHSLRVQHAEINTLVALNRTSETPRAMSPDGPKAPSPSPVQNVSAAYAAWATSVHGGFPPEAIRRAKHAFIDIVACMVAGASDPATATVRAVVSVWGNGPATVVGAPAGQAPPLAALVNGVAAHALDFDDNLDPAKAHITAVLAPALLAMAEARGLSGKSMLEAYIVGVQIATRVGQALNPYHRNRGWHATATVGTIGAAAAVGRLIGLSAAAMRHALNMSTSYAGGFMSQFGSMTKPLHAGKSAEAGVMCALFAEAGVTAGAETFDGGTGMARLMVGPDLDELRARKAFKPEHGQTLSFDTDNVGEPLAILAHGLKLKRYPTCASTHRALDGLIALREQHGFKPADVTRIDVSAPVSHFNNLMYVNPSNGAEAKFSMEYCLAVALRNGSIGLADFTPGSVADASFRSLMPLVRRIPVDKQESEFPTRVDIALKDGRTLTTTVDAPKGRADNPLREVELWDKLRQCCRGVLDDDAVSSLTRELARLDEARSVADVMAPLRFTAAPSAG